MRLVIIESPWAQDASRPGPNRHLAYARLALRDSLLRGEAPIASHLLYPQVLDDSIPAEREAGIAAGHAWYRTATFAAFYIDLGMSAGMQAAMSAVLRHRVPFEYRHIPSFEEELDLK